MSAIRYVWLFDKEMRLSIIKKMSMRVDVMINLITIIPSKINIIINNPFLTVT